MKWLAFALVVLLALPVCAEPPAPDPQAAVRSRMADGEKRYADQEYRAAIDIFQSVLADSTSTRDQRARAYEYIGLSWLILGKKQRAREAFEDLLSIDPHYTLSDPSHSPKLREFFEEVRATFVPGYSRAAAGEAELEHSAPAHALAGRPVELIAVPTRNAQLVKGVTLHWRRPGLVTFSAVSLRAEGGRFVASFTPPREPADYSLEYYLEAHDAKDRVVARVASPQSPIALPVTGNREGPTAWYKRWYVWAAVGAVVAGVAIGATVAATAEKAPDGSLPPGKVTLGLSF
jgi:tetratricopeptide (TPR) repeat protein